YQKSYGYDIEQIIPAETEIAIYQCPESGYKFYWPLNLAGDSKFYETLSSFPWYYEAWKWEHDQACDFIKDGDSICEVGCGQAAFLKRLVADNPNLRATGVELNKSAERQEDRLQV
ncbi:MAG: hypothetical protein ACPF8V_10650, partial [Luteibaculum sp.]